MTTTQTIWNGTADESHALVTAIARNCGCEFGLMSVRLSTCAPHKMMTEDQRALNGLIFMRRQRRKLWDEELANSCSEQP